jgi:hypothetical protein
MINRFGLTYVLSLVLLSACTSSEIVCPEGQTACGKQCVSLLTHSQNCGACGVATGRLDVCSGGALVCKSGIATCGGACTDLARDPANCGACGAACAAQQYCTTQAGATSCTESCPEGFAACDRACVVLAEDPFHCGACGNACAAGETCRDGACRADLHVACLNTSEVVSVTADLAPAGDPRPTPTGPGALALLGDALFSANGWPQASVSVLPLDASRPRLDVPVDGDDLQAIVPYANVLLVSNSARGTLLVLDAAGAVLDEIPLPDQQSGPNPHGIAVVGTTAYVALYGHPPSSGQRIATVDLAPLAACAAPDAAAPACGAGGACPQGRGCLDGVCRVRCGVATGTIDLLAVPGSHDAPGLPLPTGAVAASGRVYVSLSNLADDPTDTFAFYVKPAGSGKIAVVDPAGPAVSILDLGSACWKPGAMSLQGTTLWVACGSFSFPDLAPGVLLPIELSSGTPVIGTPIDVSTVVPGRLAFCGGMGYLADQSSGAVVRFDPVAKTAAAPAPVCPTGPFGFTAVSDVACAF